MDQNFYAIVNGAAGGGRCRARADGMLRELSRAGIEAEVRLTEGPGHATELARDAFADGHRRFLSVGGDGTAFEVLNGLKGVETSDEVPTLGILPLGTGNSFLRDFDITSEERALEALKRGERHRADVVRVTHRDGVVHYMNILGIGFAAQVGALTNERFKPLGAPGYVLAIVVRTVGLEPHPDPYRLDEAEPADERPFIQICFCNSRYTGGSMMMAPTASVSDGKLDVIRVGAMSRGRFLTVFPKVFSGTHTELPNVEEKKAARVEFLVEHEQPVMIDGEVRSLVLRSLEVVPGAIEVIA